MGFRYLAMLSNRLSLLTSNPITLYSIMLSSAIVLLSCCALAINQFFFHYPGNSYFPEHMPVLCSIILLIYYGLALTFDKQSSIRQRGSELLYFFCMMSLIALATSAVQYTPFSPIDSHLLKFEKLMHVNMPAILLWMRQHDNFRYLLACIYDGLVYQMSFIPLILIAWGKLSIIREYYFLMLLTTLIGFTFYYFFPTTAPASVIHSALFIPSQLATGLKFNQIHHHIQPSTLDGGLIALPSFHVIWALLCVYLLKDWPLFCGILLLINLLLISSCVLLGWHYLIDVLTGFLIAALSLLILNLIKNTGFSEPIFL